MKLNIRQSNKKAAFTIVELLTVMSIIIILIGIIAPAMNKVRRFAKKVQQKDQFHGIGNAIELFHAEMEGYPPSDMLDEGIPRQQYCGAMKLAEAMVGQDLLGFHPNSRFIWGEEVYDKGLHPDLSVRKDYLPVEQANAYRLIDLYGSTRSFPTVPLRGPLVLCDVYNHITHLGEGKLAGKLVGMPVLYYKADISETGHNPGQEFWDRNIYDFSDNLELLRLGIPGGEETERHPMTADIFYEKIRNDKLDITIRRPYRADSYILISAGWDGRYGTGDDVFNF